ncbi:lactonase family protein [Bradyrhizobium sp. LTSPM299]|uniref:lactonase family protein n=1 Tax=Bradyrhizobium sp. LTSPM299 TaxID=1619233 RepID=UPI0009E60A2F|nr:lactonase family protein [Bradyrhizobium sp. LTSPM299]
MNHCDLPAFLRQFPEADRATVSRRRLLESALSIAGSFGLTAIVPRPARGAEPRSSVPETLSSPDRPAEFFAYVGSRTSKERNARGEGISVYQVDRMTSKWTLVEVKRDLVNPSFLTLDQQRRFLYSVHGDKSEVSAFRIDARSGRLDFINTQSTKGSNPVHSTVDASNRHLVLANYATGTVVTLPIDENGALGQVRHQSALLGEPGPHRIEQKSSHPHQAAFDRNRRFIAVPDKGLDRIFVFKLDADGQLLPNDPPLTETQEGAGPRHIAFHPTKNLAYVVNELNSTLTTYAWNPDLGALKPLQILPSTPPDHVGNNRAAEIAIAASGRHVYVSNRGHDSIGLFSADDRSGLLSSVEWTPAQGNGPRFFALGPFDRHLYAANELTDSIVQFEIDTPTGRLRHTGQTIETGSPVCVVFADA